MAYFSAAFYVAGSFLFWFQFQCDFDAFCALISNLLGHLHNCICTTYVYVIIILLYSEKNWVVGYQSCGSERFMSVCKSKVHIWVSVKWHFCEKRECKAAVLSWCTLALVPSAIWWLQKARFNEISVHIGTRVHYLQKYDIIQDNICTHC